MKLSNPQFITDNTGTRISVVLPYAEYQQIIEELEERHTHIQRAKSKTAASSLRGKLSPMTNEQIDKQFNEMRNEWL